MTYFEDTTTLIDFSSDDDKMLILDGKQRLGYFENHENSLYIGMAKPVNPLIRFIKKSLFK